MMMVTTVAARAGVRSSSPSTWRIKEERRRSRRRCRAPLAAPKATRRAVSSCLDVIEPAEIVRLASTSAGDAVSQSGLASALIGPILFLTPGASLAIYSLIKGKGNFKNGFSRVLTEVSQGYFQPAAGGADIREADGDLSDLVGDEPLFVALYKWFLTYGGVYRLAFGPKAFLVVSDPVTARHVLRDQGLAYDKGMLAEILEPIMGKGLIPADVETWKVRRRAIVPGFHKAYLDAMVGMFQRCAETTCRQLSENKGTRVDMEAVSLNFALDVIGLAVFNYDFGSITSESPIIQAVYSVLKEAEHRSTFYLPYWNIPGSYEIVPRLRRFKKDLSVINDELDRLIERANATASPEDVEALQARDYSSAKDPSLLRFLVDLRGEDASAKQLRDDLMTMLIAGHETTAQVLTWAIFLLAQNQDYSQLCQDEIDALFEKDPDATLTTEDLYSLRYVRLLLAESLRLYPQPPLLIRRALEDDVLAGGLGGNPDGYPIGKGTDIFISIWNLHRSPELWERPDEFDPLRFEREFKHKDSSEGPTGWSGFDPLRANSNKQLYPNEIQSDFAFLPFGGGPRKCVGDQFAFMEAIVFMALFLRTFDFKLAVDPKSIGMKTGATIHTANGLPVSLRIREHSDKKKSMTETPSNVPASS